MDPNSDHHSSMEVPTGPILTLFVSGLPKDVKYREVYNFFRFFQKFTFVSLDNKGRAPLAFVTFDDRSAAEDCQQCTNGMAFDVDDPVVLLRVDFAKKNSILKKRTRTEIEEEKSQDKRFRNDSYSTFQQSPQPQAAAQFGASPYAAQYGYAQQQYAMGGQQYAGAYGQQHWVGASADCVAFAQNFAAYHGHTPAPPAPCTNPPCSTLFIANISRDTTEEEFKEAFQGCQRLRFNPAREKGGPIVFIEYDSAETGTAIRDILNGFRFKSDNFGRGIKIEFAKNKMGTPSSRQGSNFEMSGANSQPLSGVSAQPVGTPMPNPVQQAQAQAGQYAQQQMGGMMSTADGVQTLNATW